MSWSDHINELVGVAIAAIFGFGIALYFGSTFLTALPSGSIAANTVSNVIVGFGNAISTVFVPIILVLFILFLYGIAVAAKIIKPIGGR